MNEVARWMTLQDSSFAVPLKGAIARIVNEFRLSPAEAGQVLQDGMLAGAIAVQSAHTGAQMMPTLKVMATEIDWATGFYAPFGQPLFPLVLHWPDVERVAKGRAPGPTIDGVIEPPVLSAIAAPISEQLVRAVYSAPAMAAWFKEREYSWPPGEPKPNEAADMAAAKRHFDSVPSRDEFRRIRQAKTSEKWRKMGPRIRR